MSQNKSLSTQEVADILHVSKSTIYDLIKKGEIHSYKIGRKVRFTQDDVDAYIARSRHEHSTRPVKNIDTHSTLLTPEKQNEPELIISGQDVVLDILANYLQQEGIRTARTYLNSFEGLLSLYQDNIHVAACHLFDGHDYNASFVRSLMPGIPAVLINVSYRTQGFYVQKGNPKNIKGWSSQSCHNFLGQQFHQLLADMGGMLLLPTDSPGDAPHYTFIIELYSVVNRDTLR